MKNTLKNLAKRIEKNVITNKPAPISFHDKSNPINPIPINKNIKFSNINDRLWYILLILYYILFTFTFLLDLLRLGTAYLAIEIPQNIILTIPENSNASAIRYETHGTINKIKFSNSSIVSFEL